MLARMGVLTLKKIREDSMSRTYIHRPGGSRRAFFGRVATVGALAGGGFLRPTPARADDDDEGRPNPIPGGLAPFAPFAIFIHHNPLNPALPLANINDPSQITDFNGFVGLTHTRRRHRNRHDNRCQYASRLPGGYGL
jgi:hypothetical protein